MHHKTHIPVDKVVTHIVGSVSEYENKCQDAKASVAANDALERKGITPTMRRLVTSNAQGVPQIGDVVKR